MTIIFFTVIVLGILLLLLDYGIINGVILLLLISIFFSVALKIYQKRINNFLIVTRLCKNLHQSISLKLCIRNILKNNFDVKNGTVKTCYKKKTLLESKKIEEFFKNNRGKTFNVKTHGVMIDKLKKYERKKIITISLKENKPNKYKVSESKIIIVLTKIDYIGIGSLINLCNQSYRRYLLEPLKMKEYTIHVL